MVKRYSNQRITKIKRDLILDLVEQAEKIPVEQGVTEVPAGADLTPYPDLTNLRTWVRDNLLSGINGVCISGYNLKSNRDAVGYPEVDKDFFYNPGYLKFTTCLDGLILNTQEAKVCNNGGIYTEESCPKPGLQLSNLLVWAERNGTDPDTGQAVPQKYLPCYRNGYTEKDFSRALKIKLYTGALPINWLYSIVMPAEAHLAGNWPTGTYPQQGGHSMYQPNSSFGVYIDCNRQTTSERYDIIYNLSSSVSNTNYWGRRSQIQCSRNYIQEPVIMYNYITDDNNQSYYAPWLLMRGGAFDGENTTSSRAPNWFDKTNFPKWQPPHTSADTEKVTLCMLVDTERLSYSQAKKIIDGD